MKRKTLPDITSILPGWKTFLLFLFLMHATIQNSSAQIGYQVALIDNATGEPRALETVKVDLTITNNAGTTIFSGTQTATTNDFGIISLTVGNENTFKNVDWTKLPLFISASVDGVLLGKTQILSVPVAEYAKTTGTLTLEKLCSKSWRFSDRNYRFSFTFEENGTGDYHYTLYNSDGTIARQGNYALTYYVQGNIVIAKWDEGSFNMVYIPERESFSVSEARIYE